MGEKSDGVEDRGSSLRVHFTFNGEKCKETLKNSEGVVLPATSSNIKFARRVSADVRRAIERGTFDYAEFFPHSTRASRLTQANTLGQVGEMWLAAKGQLTPATKYQHEQALEMWYSILGKGAQIESLTYQVISSKFGQYPWPSAKRANNALIPLRGVMEFYYMGPKSVNNPMQYVQNLKVVRKLPDPLVPSERDQILTFMRRNYDERVWAYFTVAFFTGMRPEELIAMKWGDIDFQDRVVRISRVRTFKGSERDGSKTHSERDVDLVDPAIEALSVMKKYTLMKLNDEGEPADVFENPVTRRAWHDERSQRDHYWKPALLRLGIRYRRAYATRHTYATAALMGGLRPAYIASQLGHSLQMLLQVYARWVPQADDGSEKARLNKVMMSS